MVQGASAHTAKQSIRILILSVLLACGLALAAPTAWADPDPVAEKQAEAQAALQTLNTMLVELDEANEAYAAAVGKQEQAKNLMSQTQKKIDAQTEKIKDFQSQLSTRVRSMYRTGTSSFFDVLFGSTTFASFATNWDILMSMNADDAMLVAQTKVERNKLGKLQQTYAEHKHEADAAANEAEEIRDKANATAKHMQEVYDNLSAEAEELLAAQQAALAAEAEAAAAAAAEAAAAEAAAAAAAAQQQADADAAAAAAAAAPQVVQEAPAAVDPGAGQEIAVTDITNFDADTGTATLTDGSTTKVVGYDSNTGNAIVDLAATFVGGNYKWGAEDPTTSTFDCSGLVQYVYAQNGITVGGHNDRAILNAGTVVDSSEAQAGDILWWDGHVAIYAGDNMMISADNEKYGITYREITDGATYVRY